MKKNLLTVCILFLVSPAFASNVLFFKKTEKGETVFEIFNSKHISFIRYVEEIKVLRIHLNTGNGNYKKDFIVNSSEEALKIVNKIFNENDKSLLKLELK